MVALSDRRKRASARWVDSPIGLDSSELLTGSLEPVSKVIHALLRLQAFDVVDQIRDSLLDLSFVALVNAREQRPPHRHVLAAV